MQKEMLKRAALILAGGKGTRVDGCEKALMTYQGESFLKRQIQILSPIVDEIIISCRDEKQQRVIEELVQMPCVVDQVQGMGPVSGIYAGFSQSSADVCFIVAGDMPLLHEGVISFLFEEFTKEPDTCAALVPCWNKQELEPLHAIYRRKSVFSYLESHRDVRKMYTILSDMTVRYLPVEKLRQYDEELRFFTNVNTPKDLADLAL